MNLSEQQLKFDVLEISVRKQIEMIWRRWKNSEDAEVGTTRKEASRKTKEEILDCREEGHDGKRGLVWDK